MAFYEKMGSMPPEDREFYEKNLGVHDDLLDAYHAGAEDGALDTRHYDSDGASRSGYSSPTKPKEIKHFAAIISHG